jgi:hypothetical protein
VNCGDLLLVGWRWYTAGPPFLLLHQMLNKRKTPLLRKRNRVLVYSIIFPQLKIMGLSRGIYFIENSMLKIKQEVFVSAIKVFYASCNIIIYKKNVYLIINLISDISSKKCINSKVKEG